jgi:thiosulfate/3-mercaptopyruvate sulfurtransferase
MSLLLCTLLLTAPEPPAKYPRAEILAEPADYLTPASRERVRFLDARGEEAYAAGHVPGAVRVNAAQWSREFTPGGPLAGRWARLLAEVGVSPGLRVVVYGGDDVRDAARVWWILKYCGVPHVRLLNGGWPAWQAAGGPVSQEVPALERSPAGVAPQPARLATKQQLQRVLQAADKPQIVDARSEAEHCGEMQTARRNGAIPGAVHLEWKDLLDPQTRKFKAPAELSALFKERGIDPSKPAVTYCQSGGRAAVLAFGLELMGGREVANYYGSWAEWGNAEDTPVEKKPKKK